MTNPVSMAKNHQCSNWKVRINFIGQTELPMHKPAAATTRTPANISILYPLAFLSDQGTSWVSPASRAFSS